MSSRNRIGPRVGIGLTVVSFLAGMAAKGFIGTDSSDPGSTDEAPAVQEEDRGPGPWTLEDGIPSGFARTEAGAIAAAASYVTTGQALLDLPPTQVAGAVRRFASAETADRQVASITDQLDALRDVLSAGTGRTRYLQAVLATRLDSFAGDRAGVTVWSVSVLWRPGAADPQAGWTTSAFDLVWEADTWKVRTETMTSGPTPAPNGGMPPVDATELDRLLADFAPWSSAR